MDTRSAFAQVLILALLLALPGQGYAAPVAGELDGAPYVVWPPTAEADARVLLILAPGYRPPDAPRVPRFDPTEPDLAALHAAGWTLAATAYRRNGWIMADAMADLVALTEHLSAAHGPFRHILLQGSSMGGLIVTRLMEDPAHAPRFAGALALGAALGVDPAHLASLGGDPADLTLTHQPRRPLLYLSNRTELAGPLAYVAQVAAGPAPRLAAAAVIERPGHVNLTPAEREAGLRTLLRWAEGERPPRLADATVAPPTVASAAQRTAGGLVTRVTRIDPDFGNLDLDATYPDLVHLGLDYGDTLTVAAGDQTATALIAAHYGAVPRGEWVLVVLPDQRLRLALHHGNAARALGVSPDQGLRLQP
jgi:hypothetical protein